MVKTVNNSTVKFLHYSGGTRQYNQARQRNKKYKHCKREVKLSLIQLT